MEEKEIKEVKQKSKKNSGLIAIVIIMSLVIVGLVGYICYDKGIIFESEKKEVSEKEENKDKEVAEKEISDNLLIKDLSEKITYLNTQNVYKGYTGFANAGSKAISISNYEFRDDIYDTELTDDIKLDIVLNSLLNNFENLSIAYENMDASSQELFKPHVEIGRVNDIAEMQISSAKVEERYLSLFGQKLTAHKNVEKCPMFVYDSKNKVYYYTRACGGTAGGATYLYKNKFAINGNKAYVYVNVGFALGDNVFDDYPKYQLVDENTAKVVENYTEGFSINESNYSKYSEYKYTFEKDANGNYYFVGVEKIIKL